MKKIQEDAVLVTHNQLFHALEPDTDALRRDEDRPKAASSEDRRTDYRVWRCNGVTIGLRIRKART